ncbi:tripartite tricarboxylate transporter TctB family protein [Chelatococcus sp. SYSU_G07232]|uniref:Tripartite tricarboxylate transporter TctB family protein n=1 Tax=Chelatococcus albus TaxID=3047466 RepID=A0ABT7AH23_9HYPH|nr:tripartite tricarboxylate transporter TctB family protein [Chelatococcus sp. SYSU_G07232]MDJ1158659.1 tripartite tricarboxylate transporter TctB family protein [Chelatococcus sp. SYSU_G07232]
MKADDRVVLSRFTLEVVTALVTLAAGAVVMGGAVEYAIGWDETGPQPGYFPFRVGLVIALASLGVLAQAFVTHRGTGEAFVSRERLRRVAAFLLPVVGFVFCVVFLGLYVATALYLFAVMLGQGGYRWPFAAVVSLGVTGFFFVLFEWWFKVPLVKGPAEALLGIH